MIGTSEKNFNPEFTPNAVKRVITFCSAFSIFIALFNHWLPDFFSLPSLTSLFTLSLSGVQKGFFWQPLTYFFIGSSSIYSPINMSFLMGLLFNMYCLWILGCTIVDYLGENRFIQLFLSFGLIIGLMTLFTLFVSSSPLAVFGAVPVFFAFLMLWGMLGPKIRLFLFSIFPMQLKTLIAAVFGVTLLIEISNQNWIQALFYTFGICVGYLYGILFLNLESPFLFMKPVDAFFSKVKAFFSKEDKSSEKKGKIFDFLTGHEILKDEDFVEAMLSKISKYGQSSLTRQEKQRLDQISKKKK